jgi:hypothetical protein
MGLLFALISETTLVTPAELYRLAKPLEQNGQHCAADWNMAAPAVVVCEARIGLPTFCQPIVFIDDDTDPGALAVHYWDPIRLAPAARVWVNRASGLTGGAWSVSEAAGHEVVEALIDPRCDLWTDCPGRIGVDIALEVGDPVQDAYLVDGVAVANYVTPAYFDTRLGDPDVAASFRQQGGKFDRIGTLERAGTIGPEGYAIFRDATHRWTEDVGGPRVASTKPGATHFMARTIRRQLPMTYEPKASA